MKESGYNPEVKFSLLSGLKDYIRVRKLGNFEMFTMFGDHFSQSL